MKWDTTALVLTLEVLGARMLAGVLLGEALRLGLVEMGVIG